MCKLSLKLFVICILSLSLSTGCNQMKQQAEIPSASLAQGEAKEDKESEELTKEEANHPTLFGEKGLDTKKDDPTNEPKKGDLNSEISPAVLNALTGNTKITQFDRGPIDCYNATPGSLSVFNSVRLCEGAISAAPAQCYNRTGSIPVEESITLCKQAVDSSAPIRCYNQTGSIDVANSVRICAGATDADTPMACYRSTSNGLNVTDSSVLCSRTTSILGPIECYNLTGSIDRANSARLCSQFYRRSVTTGSSSPADGVTLRANGTTVLTAEPGARINYAYSTHFSVKKVVTYYTADRADTCPGGFRSGLEFNPWVRLLPGTTGELRDQVVQRCQSGVTYTIVANATLADDSVQTATIIIKVL